jgi:hypothetical protein
MNDLPKIALSSNGLRKCIYCKEAKPISEYKYKEGDSKNCESCYHKYIKHKTRKKEEAFHYILIGDGDWYSCYFKA